LKPRPLRIGSVTLRPHRPTLIAPFTDATPESTLAAAARAGLDLLEARVDLFRERATEAVGERLAQAGKYAPLLLTIRSAAEGGAWKARDAERLELYGALLPLVDAVDVELAASIRRGVVQAARRAGRVVVLSHHDFKRTPGDAVLDRIVQRGFAAGADVVKIATQLRDDADVARLAALFARHATRALVVIGMGEHGKKTRIFLPALGSLFTFASLDRATAPGQLDLESTQRELRFFFPDYGSAKKSPKTSSRPRAKSRRTSRSARRTSR
jgi:3-dehydroquinate dehydratase-1